ncbi:MAG TPA: hypothetical protein PKK61_09080 [Defluviitaleaceae bacterium]|nr:hypothetical protein [Candidatus Epulonipiscium sp.]HOA81198.1 hypothetical protein [Defluviitaleaceae bacterium]
MEKKRSSYSYSRKKSRNRKTSTKELFLNLLMKQFVVSSFLFVLIIILNLLPLKSTINLMQNINERIYYTMTWNEAVETLKYTAFRIPKVKDWMNSGTEDDRYKEDEKENKSPINNGMIQEDVIDIDNLDKIDDDIIDTPEDIFIIEPDLGESQEGIIP